MDDRNDANIAVIPICDSLSFSSSFRSSTKLRILLRQCRICQKLSQASLIINTIRFFTIILIIGETRKSSYQRADSPFSSILLLVPSSSLRQQATIMAQLHNSSHNIHIDHSITSFPPQGHSQQYRAKTSYNKQPL